MRQTIVIFLVLSICVCSVSSAKTSNPSLNDASADIADILKGLAAATGSSTTIDVSKIFECGFADIADVLESATIDLVKEASACDTSKAADIQKKLQALLNSFPKSLAQCLEKVPDAQSLMKGLHLVGLTQDQVQAKIKSYIENNPLTTCWDLQGLESDVNVGSWGKFGQDSGNLIITIFTSSENQLGAHKDHFVDILKGIASNVDEPIDVSSIADCGNERTYRDFESTLLPLIDEASTCSLAHLNDVLERTLNLLEIIPDSQADCLIKNPEGKKLVSGFGILNLTFEECRSKIIHFFETRLLVLCPMLSKLNQKLKNSDFQGFGAELGKIGIEIFKLPTDIEAIQDFAISFLAEGSSTPDAIHNVTAIFNGLAKATNTTGITSNNIRKCIKNDVAENISSVYIELIKHIAVCKKTRLAQIVINAQRIIGQIPKDAKKCLAKEPGIKKILDSYGVLGSEVNNVVSKVTFYAINNFNHSCKVSTLILTDINNQDWRKAGIRTGKFMLSAIVTVSQSLELLYKYEWN